MFKSITLGQSYSNKEYKKVEGELKLKLFELQQACEQNKLSVLITLSGVEGSGRGDVLNTISSWLDIKKVRNHTFWNPSDEDLSRPTAWRYWMRLPKTGEFAIFFNGWYGELFSNVVFDKYDDVALFRALHKKIDLERMLAYSNCINVKLWLHLDEKEYIKRRKQRLKDKLALQFSPLAKKPIPYAKVIEAASRIIHTTDSDFAPWCIIDAYDKNFRDLSIGKALIENIEHAINKQISLKELKETHVTEFSDEPLSILDRIDLSLDIKKADYKKELLNLQKQIARLSFRTYKKGISTTIIFEGWDAGGKGGVIRRLARAVDSRISQIIPISVPTDEELAHHYLWRFWRHIPRAGFVTIFDRSWYGRVLVERIEGLTRTTDWKRAYAEINEFEDELIDNKNILLKFWLQISPEEQLARFKEREVTPWKQYKLTEDDWRNRAKIPQYNVAADEMFMRTNTAEAPWYIISAESKQYARIEVLRIYKDALLRALGEKNLEVGTSAKVMSIAKVKEKIAEANKKLVKSRSKKTTPKKTSVKKDTNTQTPVID